MVKEKLKKFAETIKKELKELDVKTKKLVEERIHWYKSLEKKEKEKLITAVAACTGLLLTLVLVIVMFDKGMMDEEQVFKGDLSKVLEQDEERKDTYIIGAGQLPTVYQVYLQDMEGAQIIKDLAYPGLAEYASGNYEHILADKITFSDNGKTAHIKVDSTICFSDGCKITADDVVYSYYYLGNPKVAYDQNMEMLCIDGMEAYQYAGAENISGIEKISDTEVKISFAEESLDNLSMFLLPILHPESHEYTTFEPGIENLGAGSYQMESHTPYAEAVLTRNEHAKEEGEYSTIKVVLADITKLEKQEIDAMIISANDYKMVEELGSYDIYRRFSQDRDFIVFNLDETQMQEEANRAALAGVLNREELFSLCYEEGRYSNGLISGDKEKPNYESLVDDKGSVDSLKIVLPSGYSETEEKVLSELKRQWDAAGADVSEGDGENSVYYYYGRVETLMEEWQIPGFYKDLDGKQLSDAGDLLEKRATACMYAIPLHNAGYYTINLCNKEEAGILNNRY